jgi:hypothetical protein
MTEILFLDSSDGKIMDFGGPDVIVGQQLAWVQSVSPHHVEVQRENLTREERGEKTADTKWNIYRAGCEFSEAVEGDE